MRRKHTLILLTSACAALPLHTAHAQSGPTVILSLTASGGNWTAYAQTDSSSDNLGLATFAIDVIGSDGVAVATSYDAAPIGSVKVGTKNLETGFSEFPSNGVGGGSNSTGAPGNGIAITAGQNVTYGSANSPNLDQEVIQGFAKTAGSQGGISWTVPSEIAYGTYTGNSGSLTVQADTTIGHGLQSLINVSAGKWIGPGNVSFDTVLSAVVMPAGTPLPPPFFGSTASRGTDIAAAGATVTPAADDQSDVITETGGHGNASYDAIHIHFPGTGVSDPEFQFTGFQQGDNIDILLKFSNTATGGDPVTGDSQLLSDIENYITAGNGSAITVSSPTAVVAAAFPNLTYDLQLQLLASAGDPLVNLDFADFAGDGLSAGQLGLSDIGLVPEPASAGLLILGGIGLIGHRRRKCAE